MVLQKEFRFEASHVLPKHPGKCSRLHGHSWKLTVAVIGLVDPGTGMVMDYADISKAVNPLIEKLDHRHLGAWAVHSSDRKSEQTEDVGVGTDVYLAAEIWGTVSPGDNYFENWAVPGLPRDFNPTSENLLQWIRQQLEHLLPNWHYLKLDETCTCSAIIYKEGPL